MSEHELMADGEDARSGMSIANLAAELDLPETTLARVLAAVRGRRADVPTDRSARRWLSISEVAAEMGMSEMTLYRVIAADEFPAVRVGRRLFIPARVLDEMTNAALATGRLVTAAEWCGANE